jgi:hypothetical protein
MVLTHPTDAKTESAVGFHFASLLRGTYLAARFFSTRTPLNFLAAFFFFPDRFNAMNSPEVRSRLVQADAPPSAVLVCERFFTAPLRALSPIGLY